jgi:preprotein translocase subunit SecE
LTIWTKESTIKRALRGAFLKGVIILDSVALNRPARRDSVKSMSKIVEYIKETRGELRHVVWPTRNQTILYTIIVVVLSLIISYFLGIFDFIFSKVLDKILGF